MVPHRNSIRRSGYRRLYLSLLDRPELWTGWLATIHFDKNGAEDCYQRLYVGIGKWLATARRSPIEQRWPRLCMRNLCRGRGVGFFEAGDFHPDFILWRVSDSCQHIAFVDPKSTLLLPPTDAKLEFYQTIKEIEERLGDPTVRVESFIVTHTPAWQLEQRWQMRREEMRARHLLFQEDTDTYIETLLTKLLGDPP